MQPNGFGAADPPPACVHGIRTRVVKVDGAAAGRGERTVLEASRYIMGSGDGWKEKHKMKRYVYVAALALVALAPLVAQTPKGWKMRVDRSTVASDPDAPGDIKFMTMGSGLHAINPQAAVYWNPANTAAGAYTVKGTFTLLKPSGHNNYYGLVLGGSALEGAEQSYLYFVVAQDGTWLIKRREGSVASTVLPKTPNDAVKKPDAGGKSTNALEVRVGADKLEFVVNGVVVHTGPKSGAMAKADGIYGIRVNHLLEVHIDGLTLSK
jgi:hypothetical protein